MRRWVVLFVTSVAACGGRTEPGLNRKADAPVGPCPDTHPCSTEHCSLVVPAGALPVGAGASIIEHEGPESLKTEAIAPFVCEISVTAPPITPIDLTIVSGANVPPQAVIFQLEGAGATAVGSSTPAGDRVQALVGGAGVYGVTLRPSPWKLTTTFSDDPLTSDDPPSLLRNLSLNPITAAFFDGDHLFVGNGPRVLAYDGIPDSPVVLPSFVLGAPDLDHIPSGVTSSTLDGGVGAIWSNRQRLVVATGNRVLIWNSVPRASFAPADLVLGQQDFASNGANVGGVSASTLSTPTGLDSDGHRLVVADMRNNRVLIWSPFPTSIGEPASAVLGQPTFEASAAGLFYQAWGVRLAGKGAYVASFFTGTFHFESLATNAMPDFFPYANSGATRVEQNALTHASGVALLPDGALGYFDPVGGRVAVQRAPTSQSAPMDFALGQVDPTRASISSPCGASFHANARTLVDSNGVVLVPDGGRLLVYRRSPSYGFQPADFVLGQSGPSANETGADYRRMSGKTLAHPADVAVHGTTIAIADRANNRVLLFKTPLPTGGAPAPVAILGQTDEHAFLANGGSPVPNALTLSGPAGVALDDQHLYVSDAENHRVLVWSPIPSGNAVPATFVLGQSTFFDRLPNHGNGDDNGDGFSDADARGLFFPQGLASNGAQLFVVDRANHRVLSWEVSALKNGKAADRVLGQEDFQESRANHGEGAFAPRLDGFNLPTGATIAGDSLWIADTENNRVVEWRNASSVPTAASVVGQVDGATIANPNYWWSDSPNVGQAQTVAATASTLLRPRSVVRDENALYVSELDGNRVHVFRANGASWEPLGQIGQPNATTNIPNSIGIGAGALSAPSGMAFDGRTLFVADDANHRVLGFSLAGATVPVTASLLLGQPTFVSFGFNHSSATTTAGGATRPHGIALSNQELFVAESSRSRVLVHEIPLVPGRAPTRILGQIDESGSLPNAGGEPSAATLNGAQGVYADDTRVVVADTLNHRVLIYPRSDSVATVVLGQASFSAVARNRNGSTNAASLSSPSGVWVDGERLYVADTGNHRVLVWNSVPTESGVPADLVLGQNDFTSGQVNQGRGAASASTAALPAAVLVAGGKVFIADSGNNRVLVFDAATLSSSVAAENALGQSSMTDRTASSDINNATRLSGPVALATDGLNLFVSDRDANRILSFDLASLATGVEARALYNANNGLVAAGPAGLAVERIPLFTSRLYVADKNNDRVLVLEPVSRLR